MDKAPPGRHRTPENMAGRHVQATLDGAQIFLNGNSIGTTPPSTAGITALIGHRFSSSGTTSQYDHFLIDDIEQS